MSEDKPVIQPVDNGPLIVRGQLSVTRMADGQVFEIDGKAALCRCGGSSNKPFCDGSHKTNGFSSAKEPDRVPDQREDYVGEWITIHDNRGLCAHAGYCTDQLRSVFRLGEEPWIDPDGASAEAIAEVVSRCPSGALAYSMAGREQRAFGGEPAVFIAPNGPYAIKGGAAVLEGVELPEGATMDHYDLCRCGRSKNKPFCNGAHWDVDFDEDAGSPTD